MSVTSPPPAEAPQRRSPLAYLPLVVFVALVVLLFGRLFAGDPSRLPSALINKSAPQFDLPPLLATIPGLADRDLRQGHVTVLNIFASWCGPCREENPQLVALAPRQAARRPKALKLVGIAYKESAGRHRRYLGQEGNPYAAIGVDASGPHRHRLRRLWRAGNPILSKATARSPSNSSARSTMRPCSTPSGRRSKRRENSRLCNSMTRIRPADAGG